MNILFACHRFPFPPNRGGKIRSFHMIQHLARRHSVTVVSTAHSRQELALGAGLQEYCADVVAEVIPPSVRWLRAWAALPTGTPSSAAYFSSPPLLRKIREKVAAVHFGCVVVHCAFAAQYVDGIACGRRILDFGDVDSGKWSAFARARAFPFSLGYAVEARKLRRYEQYLTTRFDRLSVTTRAEQQHLDALSAGAPSRVIPNGVDTTHFRPRHADGSGAPTIVFLGQMDYFPNVHGIEKFVHEMLPAIRRQLPEVKLEIVGAEPRWRVRRLARTPGVIVTGGVPDVRTFLDRASVSVAPIYFARGTQNKILESMAAGVPVVTTPQVAKGTSAVAGQHFLVADAPEQFAGHVVRVLQEPALRRELSLAGRAYVEREHSWERSLAALDAILGEA